MRRHLTYANVTATLALVFAMTGGALAAKHYLINSTSQINPKVLKKLRGHAGPRGAVGATGATGATGGEGPPGKPGADGKAAPALEGGTGPNEGFPSSIGAPELVLAANLTPGTYTLVASTDAENDAAAKQSAECDFRDEHEAFDTVKVEPGPTESRYIALPEVLYTATKTPFETVQLACKASTTEGTFKAPTFEVAKIS